jgi:serine/threonine protein kinase
LVHPSSSSSSSFSSAQIINFRDLINPASKDDFEDVYMVFEFMETDMHKIIYSKNDLTDDHCQYFGYQTLRGLRHIHAANVLHRDLKPSNLLLNGNCDLKICDFGLARGVSVEPNFELTEYVVTRWYRAPEIMCACQEYDCKIDVWSVGCILMEVLLRKPLFPGDDYIHQLNLIFQLLGTPSDDDLGWVTNEKALQYMLSLPKQKPVPFETLFAKKAVKPNPLALDLCKKMLTFNPHKRISVADALNHPYLKPLNVKEDVRAVVSRCDAM